MPKDYVATHEAKRFNEPDPTKIALIVLATSQPFLSEHFEGISNEFFEHLVEELVEIAATGGYFKGSFSFDQATRERAAMAVCRILQDRPLHLPECCARCERPVRGPVTRSLSTTTCDCDGEGFDVVIEKVGPNKLSVIKVVRQVTGHGLKEAKELVESATDHTKPVVNHLELPRAEAEAVARKLEAAGASVAVV